MITSTDSSPSGKTPCSACGAHLPNPSARRCPACGADLHTANPETITIQIGHGDSVAYLPDDDGEIVGGGRPAGAKPPTTVVGPKASLSHVGLEGGITLDQPTTGTERAPLAGGISTTLPTARIEDGHSVHELLTQRPGEEKYVIAKEIARGGMGVVMRAVDRDIRRDVAMKVLLSEKKDRARERFVEEAQITGQLEHPNIVPVHDLGVDAEGRLFFTMKLVKGRSLAEMLDVLRTPAGAKAFEDGTGSATHYSLTRLLTTYLAMLNAMAFAHDRGVIHRDLKPSNVMVGDFGEVLVMDWGLAKVAAGRSPKQWTHRVRSTNLGRLAAGRGKGRTSVVLPEPGRVLATDEKLKILVEGFASRDEIIEGKAIEGTPAYMPPEQARGELAQVDERSDIYSLGAILYELLTLSPPVRGRSVKAILEDVVAGRIMSPESRAPERTIPPELSAIAMKAMAWRKDDRYPSVIALRQDIELYLDDRQVSAKEDSTWEALIKLIRRNQEVVIAIGVCLFIVIAVTIFLFNAIINERHKYQQSAREAQNRLVELRSEQDKRAQDQRRAAPALVAKSRRAVDLKDFPEARADIDLAIQYDPVLPEARLLAAHLAIRDQDWAVAGIALNAYMALKPDDGDARQLLDLVATSMQPDPVAISGKTSQADSTSNSAHLTAIADVLVRQGAYTVAEGLYQSGRDLFTLYRVRLEKQWPGCTRTGFSADKDGRLTIEGLAGRGDVYDLTALEGMPVVHLSLAHTKAIDLTPLRRMPLASLDLTDTPVRNLEPLAGLPLTVLKLSGTRVDDLGPLTLTALEELDCSDTAVADLTPIERMPLTALRLARSRVQDLAVLTGMPLTSLSVVGTRVIDLSPLKGLKLAEFDATGTLVTDLRPLAGMRLTSLRLSGTRVTDLLPLAGMPLTTLTLTGTAVADLQPLVGMPLTSLDLSGLPVKDLAPLVGMPLTSLDLRRSPVTSIESLRGAKLSCLVLAETGVTDLSPVADMPLTMLDLADTPALDLRPLAGLPLSSLILDRTPVADIAPLRLLPLKELRLLGTRVTDLRPLCDERGAARSLERLILPPAAEKGLDGLRNLANLKQIGTRWDGSWAKVPPAAEFWRKSTR